MIRGKSVCGPCRTRLLIKGRACAKASKSSYGVLKGLTVRSVVGAGRGRVGAGRGRVGAKFDRC